jgi:concanavalin A-like lectin/glucanase superfamily protein
MAAATACTRPRPPRPGSLRTGVLGGRPVVRFDGGDALQTPSIDHRGATAVTVYTVFSCVAGGDRIVAELSPDLGTSPNAYALYRRFDDKLAMVGRGNNNLNERVSGARAAATAEFHLGCGVYNLRLHRHEAYVYLDGGAACAATAIFDNDDAATIRTDVLNIGARNQSALFLNGNIAELIVYATAQTAAERQRVEGAWQASAIYPPARSQPA